MNKLFFTLLFMAACFGGGNLSPSGDITAVHAGDGLTGGGAIGAVTLSIDDLFVQLRVTGECAAGSSIRAIASDGSVTCETDDATVAPEVVTVTGGSGTLHNVDCGGAGTAVCRLNYGTLTATGFVAGTDGQEMDVLYVGTSSLTLSHDTGSTAANRLLLPGAQSWSVGPGGGFRMRYDATSSRWRVLGPTDRLPSATISGNATVGGTLGVTGATTLSSTLDVTGAITEGSNRVFSIAGNGLTSSGATINIEASSDFFLSADQLDLSSNVTAPGALSVAGIFTASSHAQINGNTTLGTDTSDTVAVNGKISTHVNYTGSSSLVTSGCALDWGNDSRGVLIPDGSMAPCEVTFVTPWTTNPPICVASANEGDVLVDVVDSDTVIFDIPGKMNVTVRIYYHCDGAL